MATLLTLHKHIRAAVSDVLDVDVDVDVVK